MKIFQLEDIETDARYCFVDPALPCGPDISQGLPATPELERLGLAVLDLPLDETHGGLELPDYVSNTVNMLVLRRRCAEAIATQFAIGDHERLAARLINEKQRVHAEDYEICNPLGSFDCVDQKRSDMQPGPWVNPYGKWYLSRALLPADRDLFRVDHVGGYFFTERLVAFVRARGFTNFAFKPVLLC
ncbi:MAG: hypothetical protein JNK82_16170 [Myxococcaceae bacterium]|nr:hypothetical protein [Myxococcaceae bacterium]